MPIITKHHGKHGAPLRDNGFGYDVHLYCDCYDGTEDSGWQPRGDDERASTYGERWVQAALAWNEDLESMEDE